MNKDNEKGLILKTQDSQNVVSPRETYLIHSLQLCLQICLKCFTVKVFKTAPMSICKV